VVMLIIRDVKHTLVIQTIKIVTLMELVQTVSIMLVVKPTMEEVSLTNLDVTFLTMSAKVARPTLIAQPPEPTA